MSIDARTLDSAYAKLESFGPDLAMPARKRLKKEFPRLTEAEADEVLHHVALISKTVWSLAERGGETKLKKENVISELQAAHPFLQAAGLRQATFLVNYYAWHEGYDQ